MRIAFYAPMKPPDHPVPSGDRRMARLLMAALEAGGHEVALASRLISREAAGDLRRQARLEALGGRLAGRLIEHCRRVPEAEGPQLWFTYHLYDKAPDWIGPQVARELAIPYVVAEASVAPKRKEGPWARGYAAVLEALDQAAAIICLNPADRGGLPGHLPVVDMKPFLDLQPYSAAAASRNAHREALASALGANAARPWLLAVGMMRARAKLASYQVLAEALRGLPDLGWELLIAGDGPARADVEQAFRPWARGHAGSRVHFLGEQPAAAMPGIYAACDLFVWPAVDEAYGMAILEAQAAGLPVIAGKRPGIANIVRDGRSGLLARVGDPLAFAAALRTLLTAPARRRVIAETALGYVKAEHGFEQASARLSMLLEQSLKQQARAT